MKKVLAAFFIIGIFAGAVAVPVVANAVDLVDANGNIPGTNQPAGGAPASGPTTGESLSDVTGGVGHCLTHLLTCTTGGARWVTSKLLWMTGVMLNFVIEKLVMNMGFIIHQTVGIRDAWVAIRDLVNIGIIGGMVAMAIGTIINSANYNVNKQLARLIVTALLVNFSFFFAAVIIDASNFVSAKIFETTFNCGAPPPGGSSNYTLASGCGISDKFMELVKLQTIANAKKDVAASILDSDSTALWTNVMATFFFLIAAIVFFTASITLVTRFVILTLVLVASPVWIAGPVIPFLKGEGEKVQKQLINQSIFAPLLFLLIAISLKLLESMVKGNVLALNQGNGAGLVGLVSGDPTSLALVLNFMIAMGFLVASLIAAKQFGARGADWGLKQVKGVGNFALKYGAKYPAAVGLRNTVGRVGDYAGIRYEEWMSKPGSNLLTRGLKAGLKVSGADLSLQQGFKNIKDQKYFGFEGRGGMKQQQIDRDIRLSDIAKDEFQRGKLDGKKLNASEREELKNLEGKERTGTLTKIEVDRLAELREKQGAIKTGEDAQRSFDEERRLGERIIDPATGKVETWAAYWARQEKRGKFGRKRGKKEDGTWEEDDKGAEDLWTYFERMDKATGWREARGNLESITGSISDGFWERELDKDPSGKLIQRLTHALSDQKFLELMKNPKVPRHVKNAMLKERRGMYAKMIRDIEDRVDRGELIRGSDEYKKATIVAYNYAGKYITGDEFEYMITSDAVFDEKTGQRFSDLRKMNALWDASLSEGHFLKVKNDKLLGKTEQREVSKRKRGPMDDIRDREAGAYYILGYEGDNDWLPNVAGTVDYDAVRSTTSGAKEIIASRQKVIDNYEADPETHNGVSEGDYRKALEDKRYAEMIGRGPEGNPLAEQIRAATEGMAVESPEYADKKAEVIRDAREKYNTAVADGVLEDPAEREEFLKDDTMFLMHQMATAESDTVDWKTGKNVKEEPGILNKRSRWATNTAYGMTSEKLRALRDGEDPQEQDRIWENTLMRGPDSLITEYGMNENLRAEIPWPPPERMREINRVRKALGREPLPETLDTEQIIEASKPKPKKTEGGEPAAG